MRFVLFIICAVFLAGCIKEVTPDIVELKPIPVVEGLLLTDTTPCKVVLSYSGTVNFKGYLPQEFINDAIVFLKNDNGDSVRLFNQDSGVYMQTDLSFVAKVGSSYTLMINLADGSRYRSLPEKIVPVVKNFDIDSIGETTPGGLPYLHGADVQIKTGDPAGETNYYRWIADAYYPRQATGVGCGFGCIRDEFCYQFYHSPSISILSDAYIDGKAITRQSLLVSPYYSYGSHYVEIKQLSLTEPAFRFWKLYIEQTTRTGTVLDPLPAPIRGNIYNADNANEFALGYFEASDASVKKIIISPFFLNPIYTFSAAKEYIKEGACFEVYPNAQQLKPPGWENAPEYFVDVLY